MAKWQELEQGRKAANVKQLLFVSEDVRSETLREELELRNCKVTVVRNVDAALSLVRKEPDRFDAVVTELSMGHGSLGAENTRKNELTGLALAEEIGTIKESLPVMIIGTPYLASEKEFIRRRDSAENVVHIDPDSQRLFAQADAIIDLVSRNDVPARG